MPCFVQAGAIKPLIHLLVHSDTGVQAQARSASACGIRRACYFGCFKVEIDRIL